jgi:sugar O-acyltransferase (sialic acid O-acetyltransferase NeuD family)
VGLIGAGGHGKVVADAAIALARDHLVGFFDDDAQLHGGSILGLPVLGSISAWRDFNVDALVPAIGANKARRDVVSREAALGATMMTIVHPRATVSAWAELGRGTVVFAGAVINPGAVIGDNVIVNTGAIVEHDCHVGDHVHVASGSSLAGDVRVGEGSLIGPGARVLRGVTIGEWCVVGAGAVVTRDVEAHATVVGVPARRLG